MLPRGSRFVARLALGRLSLTQLGPQRFHLVSKIIGTLRSSLCLLLAGLSRLTRFGCPLPRLGCSLLSFPPLLRISLRWWLRLGSLLRPARSLGGQRCSQRGGKIS